MQGIALQDNCPFLGARKERKEHPCLNVSPVSKGRRKRGCLRSYRLNGTG